MNPLGLVKNLFMGGIGETADKVSGAIARFTGDKVQRESNVHDEQMAATNAQAAEFQYRGKRTWFDSLIDGINRLPRPIIAFGCIGLFVWCIYDPAEFSIAMTALAIMPEWLAIVIGQVILLYMGGRMLNDWKIGKGANAEQVRQVLALQNEVRAVKEQMRPEPKAHELAEEDYAAEIADTSKPMSNAAIERWNKLRHKN